MPLTEPAVRFSRNGLFIPSFGSAPNIYTDTRRCEANIKNHPFENIPVDSMFLTSPSQGFNERFDTVVIELTYSFTVSANTIILVVSYRPILVVG